MECETIKSRTDSEFDSREINKIFENNDTTKSLRDDMVISRTLDNFETTLEKPKPSDTTIVESDDLVRLSSSFPNCCNFSDEKDIDFNAFAEGEGVSSTDIENTIDKQSSIEIDDYVPNNVKFETETKQNREYKKRNINTKHFNNRDLRRRYNNHNRRGRFYSRRRVDGSQYRVLTPHVAPSLLPTQDAEVPPPDPIILQAIENDPPGVVRIADGMKEVRFYGESAIVLLDWDDPRDISFQPGSRRVIIDDLEIITLPFNASYTSYTLYDGRMINIRLGAPTRDLYIDGRYFDARFGGPPIEVSIDGTLHRIQLGGPLPHMCLGTSKRTDLIAGRITVIIDEKDQSLVYLDSKPQKIEIKGIPFVLKFNETLVSVFINGKPFRVEFGGMPLHISCYGEVHSLRFLSLPLGVIPGYVNFLDLDFQNSIDPCRNAQILDALSIRQPSSSQDFLNYHYHYHYHCSSQDSQQARPLANSAPPTSDVSPTVEYKVLLDPPNLPGQVIDVKELFKKLVEKGIVPAVSKKEPLISQGSPSTYNNVQVDLSRPETLKSRNLKVIRDLHRGNQCRSCGMRFVRRDTPYINHLRYHEEDGKPNEICLKRWWSHSSEFLLEFDEDLPSWFKRNGKLDKITDEENDWIISVGDREVESPENGLLCICCDENFSELSNEKKSECPVANIFDNSSQFVDILSNSQSEKNDQSATDSNETIVIDDSSIEDTTNEDGLIDIVSEEELEPGEIVEGQNEPEGDIIEIVEIKPKVETIVLSDDEIEEGEIVDSSEPIPLMDIDFSKVKIKKEKYDDGYYRTPFYRKEKWSLDGNSEYISANLVKPKRIKVNISSVIPTYYNRKESRRKERKRQDIPEVEPRPASVKKGIANSNLTVNISKYKGKESSALCSLM